MRRRAGMGRICHERHAVPVPDELRLAIHRRFANTRETAAVLGVSDQTLCALLDPYGVVRAEVLARVKERLAVGS